MYTLTVKRGTGGKESIKITGKTIKSFLLSPFLSKTLSHVHCHYMFMVFVNSVWRGQFILTLSLSLSLFVTADCRRIVSDSMTMRFKLKVLFHQPPCTTIMS